MNFIRRLNRGNVYLQVTVLKFGDFLMEVGNKYKMSAQYLKNYASQAKKTQ